jgi:hypothetical protein
MRSSADRDDLARRQDEATERARVAVEHRRLQGDISADPARSWALLVSYVDGGEVPVNPAAVACRMAMRATFVDRALGERLDGVTARLVDNWPALRARPWATEVLLMWPALPRVTRARLGTSAGAVELRADIVDTVPGLVTPAGWRQVRSLFEPPGGRERGWASVSSVVALLAPPVDAPPSTSRPRRSR